MTDNAESSGHLKIVRIIARLNVGGPARHVVLLNGGLDRRGHATLLVHGSVEAHEASLEHLVAAANLRATRIPELGRRIRPLDDARAFLQLARIIFREAPDVIHTHTAKAGTLGRLAACAYNLTRSRHHRAAIVHTFHGHVFEGYFPPAVGALVRLIERCLARVTDRIVTISAQQRADITERFRIASPGRVALIPLGLNLGPLFDLKPDAATYRTPLGIANDGLVIGYVGRFVPIKDLETLIQAFALVQRSLDAWLLLAGDGPERARIESLAASLGLSQRVRFLGWSEDLPRLYATMDVCALSSRNEGTPVALIEAMAAGRPVAATAVGGVVDLVRSGVTGLLVRPRQPKELAAALVQLLTNPADRLRMGAAGRRAATDYSPDQMTVGIEALYRDVVTSMRRAALPQRQ